MKILWLYQYLSSYNFDHWLHMSFAQYMSDHPGVELQANGPSISDVYPSIANTPYDAQLEMSDLYKIFPFDAVIINTKSRCFEHYNPFKDEAFGQWLPKGFAEWNKSPKIVIEEDYHYEKGDQWYQEQHIDLILQRHYSQFLRQDVIPMRFFPFSVDTTVFNPSRGEYAYGGRSLRLPNARIRSLVFVGNCGDGVYAYRREATQRLVAAKLAVSYAGTKKVNAEYVEVLRRYIGYISCGSKMEICAAKNFEIMASGGALFTNRFTGIDQIFPPDTYCSYLNDMSDVVSQGRRVVLDTGYRNHLLSRSLECIKNNHTHDIRIAQLLDIIKELIV